MSNDPSLEPEVPQGFPGEDLKNARESKGLTTADVSKAINVSRHHIEALEQADFSILPTRVFVLGYIKTYTQFLDLPEAPFIAAYNDISGTIKPASGAKVSLDRTVKMSPQPKKRAPVNKSKLFVNVLLVVLVAGVAALMWLKPNIITELTGGKASTEVLNIPSSGTTNTLALNINEQEESNGSSEQVESSVLSLPINTSTGVGSESAESSTLELNAVAESPPEQTSVLDDMPDATQGNSTPLALPVVSLDTPVTEPNAEPVTSVAENNDDESQADESLSTIVTEQVDASASSQPLSSSELPAVESNSQELAVSEESEDAVTEGRLQIVFNADCWTEVRDATGRVLVASIRNPERGVDVTGTMPISITLGAVSAIDSVSFNGQSIALSPKGNSNILRMTLPKAE